MYRQKTAVDVIYSKANRVRPEVGMAADVSSSLVISKSAPESVQGEAMPTVGSALDAQGGAVSTVPEQQKSTSESFSAAEDTSHKRKAEVSDFEKSLAKRTRGRQRPTREVARYTKAPGNISSKMYDLVCSEKYKE